MRLLVCGGREYGEAPARGAAVDIHKSRLKERRGVFDTLDKLHAEFRFSIVINGGARGADRWAREWAKANGVELRVFRANWTNYGPFAGPLRNKRMLVEGRPELVVAFPGGKGTADMVRQASSFGVAVRKVP